MPGETDANVACELSADAHTIKPHHLPIGSAPCAGKGDGTPTITNGGIGIIMPDLAIGIGPTDHNPFGPHQRIRATFRRSGDPAYARSLTCGKSGSLCCGPP